MADVVVLGQVGRDLVLRPQPDPGDLGAVVRRAPSR